MHAVEVNVERPFLVVGLPVEDPAPAQWRKLAPGEQLVGHVDLSNRLYLVAHPSKAERVQLSVGIDLRVGEGDRHQRNSKVREFDCGRLTVDVPPNARNETWIVADPRS